MTATITDAIAEAITDLAGRPADDWPALLRARFPGDPGLVAQALIWLHAQREPVLDRDRFGSLGTSTRYELAARLDAGATASVWRAYDRKLRRDVAIKVFERGSGAGASHAIADILAEARAACEVTSEHVVRVLDVHDDEPPYIVMELVGEHEPRGGALLPGASAATCRPRDLWEAVRWVRDVARGVHDAHLRNVFHRDLKPHNVLITPISRRAKIADFGLAVSSARRAAATTRSGMLVEIGAGREPVRIAGTPGYMAPEQARGLAATLDPRIAGDRATLVGVDIWGLGAIAYDLLSGRSPWQPGGGSDGDAGGAGVLPRGIDGLEAWEIAASGARPVLRDRTPSGERIPARLRRIIERALASAPGDRYTSAGELADELHAVLTWRPTSFDRSPAIWAALWSRRNPQLTATAAVAVLLAAMSVAGYATVRHLRAQRTALTAEVRDAAADQARLAGQAAAAHRELDDTEASLRALRQSLAAAEHEYRVIVQAKEEALRSASAATRALAVARGDRDIAEKARELYESFWTNARKDADDAARARDQAAHERDAARAAAEQAVRERDDARTARTRAETERDDARAERDRHAEARRQADADVARLIGELSKAVGGSAAGPAQPGRIEPPEPTAKGAGH